MFYLDNFFNLILLLNPINGQCEITIDKKMESFDTVQDEIVGTNNTGQAL